jgi:hypothetical protein
VAFIAETQIDDADGHDPLRLGEAVASNEIG